MEARQTNYHLLDTLTLSAVTGVSASTLKQWRCKKVGPSFVKMGSKVMYRSDMVEEWLENNSVSTIQAMKIC